MFWYSCFNRYCEVISQAVGKNPTAYKVEFLSQVYELACRLKYHDLHYQMYQGEVSEIPDPQWLSNLKDVLHAARQQEHQQRMELQDAAGTGDGHSYMYQQDQGPELVTQTVAVDPSYALTDTTQNHVPHMDPHSMSYSVHGSQSYQHVDPAYTSPSSTDAPDSSHYTSSPHSPSKGADATAMNPSLNQGVPGHPQVGMFHCPSLCNVAVIMFFLLYYVTKVGGSRRMCCQAVSNLFIETHRKRDSQLWRLPWCPSPLLNIHTTPRTTLAISSTTSSKSLTSTLTVRAPTLTVSVHPECHPKQAAY